MTLEDLVLILLGTVPIIWWYHLCLVDSLLVPNSRQPFDSLVLVTRGPGKGY